jgi:hypothetical protein
VALGIPVAEIKLDETGRQRLRVASLTVASPKLRVVLERAARGEEEAALAAAKEIEDGELAPRVKRLPIHERSHSG